MALPVTPDTASISILKGLSYLLGAAIGGGFWEGTRRFLSRNKATKRDEDRDNVQQDRIKHGDKREYHDGTVLTKADIIDLIEKMKQSNGSTPLTRKELEDWCKIRHATFQTAIDAMTKLMEDGNGRMGRIQTDIAAINEHIFSLTKNGR